MVYHTEIILAGGNIRQFQFVSRFNTQDVSQFYKEENSTANFSLKFEGFSHYLSKEFFQASIVLIYW